MCGPVARPEECGKATCQFCQQEFDSIKDLYRHVKGCKDAKECREGRKEWPRG